MTKYHYVTFGVGQAHHIQGKVLHPNVVARFKAESPEEGRQKAFETFGLKFSFEYTEEQWLHDEMGKYYPQGYVDLD